MAVRPTRTSQTRFRKIESKSAPLSRGPKPGQRPGALKDSIFAALQKAGDTVWNTDKDGIVLSLLAAEITARTGKDPGKHYQEMTAEFGTPFYTRIEAAATPEQENLLKKLLPEAVTATELAGEPITAKLTRAPGNDAPVGGLKVVSTSGWFAARPSGTGNIYKLYAESLSLNISPPSSSTRRRSSAALSPQNESLLHE
jgi:alpha-D-glucose phosphate-specific phosphoglucomutase